MSISTIDALKCTSKSCRSKNGEKSEIDLSENVPLNVGSSAHPVLVVAHPCKMCRKIHWENGEAVINEKGKREAFLTPEGEIFTRVIER